MERFIDFIAELFVPAGAAGPNQSPVFMIGYETWWATCDVRDGETVPAAEFVQARAVGVPLRPADAIV